jgi:phosphatidylinositol 4-kinase A
VSCIFKVNDDLR